MLWQSETVFDKEAICNTPIWLHNHFQLPIKRDRLNKGINSIADCLGYIKIPVSMEEFSNHHGVKTNFLEYNNICHKIKKILEWRDTPLCWETLPRNSTLNTLLNLSDTGCSQLYSKIKDSNDHVFDNIVSKWKEKSNVEIETNSVSRSLYVCLSFLKHHIKYKDTYQKYLQF